MPQDFNYFDPDDDDDLNDYEPSPFYRQAAIGLLVVMALFAVAAVAAVFI